MTSELKLGEWVQRTKKNMFHISNGKKYWSKFKAGQVAYQVHSQQSVLEKEEPDIGDLAIIPCEMWLIAGGGGIKSYQNLPKIGLDVVKDAAGLRFVICDSNGVPKERPSVKPVLQITCVKNIEEYLSITQEDFQASENYTKMWDMIPRYPGLFRYDYVMKTNVENPLLTTNVELYMLAWMEEDAFSVVPGIVEVRPRKHWFQSTVSPNVYKAGPEDIKTISSAEVELPVVGTLGLVVDKIKLSHGLTEDGLYVAGSNHESWFYKIMFPRRQPMWIFGPAWKCPSELILPIYLPVS